MSETTNDSNNSSDSTTQQENKKSVKISSIDFKKEGDIPSRNAKGSCGFEICWGLLFCSCL